MARLEVDKPLRLDTSHVLMYQIPRRVSGRDGEIYLGEISRVHRFAFYFFASVTSTDCAKI